MTGPRPGTGFPHAAPPEAVTAGEGACATALAGPRPEPAGGYTVGSLEPLLARRLKFSCVMADPPWRYDRQPRGAAEHHYRTMDVDEIAAMPVPALTAENAHLHLWTTSAFLFSAKRVLDAWGFAYKGVFVWVKPQIGTGHYYRNAAEFMLLGVKGNLVFRDRSVPNWLCNDRYGHSEKPEKVRAIVERVSPGPYLELFGRRPADGWTVHGDEISRGLDLFSRGAVELDAADAALTVGIVPAASPVAPPPAYLSVAQFARRFNVSRSVVYALVAGGLPHIRVGTGRGTIRIALEAAAEFERSAKRDDSAAWSERFA